MPHAEPDAAARLVRRAAMLHHPAFCVPVQSARVGPPDGWLSVEPQAVQFSAFHREGPHTVLRLWNASAQAVEARVRLPAAGRCAEAVDFNFRPTGDSCELEGDRLQVGLDQWQVATIWLEFRELPGENALR